tara:strand:- start:243 stop:1073 length:831 start_codon:yes stop_codon:yes gene_type:complete
MAFRFNPTALLYDPVAAFVDEEDWTTGGAYGGSAAGAAAGMKVGGPKAALAGGIFGSWLGGSAPLRERKGWSILPGEEAAWKAKKDASARSTSADELLAERKSTMAPYLEELKRMREKGPEDFRTTPYYKDLLGDIQTLQEGRGRAAGASAAERGVLGGPGYGEAGRYTGVRDTLEGKLRLKAAAMADERSFRKHQTNWQNLTSEMMNQHGISTQEFKDQLFAWYREHGYSEDAARRETNETAGYLGLLGKGVEAWRGGQQQPEAWELDPALEDLK